MARAPCSITTSERVNTEAGLSPVAANTRWIGRSTRRALGDVNDRAVAHQRGVERDHALALGRHDLAEMRRDQRIAGGQRLRHRADGQAGRQIGEVGQVPARTCRRRTRCAARPCRRSGWPASLARALAAASGAPASGFARASARADRCISTPRPAGSASRRRRSCRNAASRSAATLRSPGSLAFAAA